MLAELLTVAIGFAPPPAPPQLRPGERYGEIVIPRLREREVIREGTALSNLDRAIGHLRESEWPGEGGLISLWGHRVTPTNGRPHGPFRYINRLRTGDRILILEKDGTRHTYRVVKHRVVGGFDWDAFRAREREVLAIAACHPPGSARYRYVVYAHPVLG